MINLRISVVFRDKLHIVLKSQLIKKEIVDNCQFDRSLILSSLIHLIIRIQSSNKTIQISFIGEENHRQNLIQPNIYRKSTYGS